MKDKKYKIYDCFTFFNELDVLEVRLSEHYNAVDHFVIVEANKTHSGKYRPFILEKNKKRYKKYWDKVIYVKVKDMPKFDFLDKLAIKYGYLASKSKIYFKSVGMFRGFGRWHLEHFQRNAIIRGLKEAKDEDIIIVSDLDEILRSSKIKEIAKALKTNKMVQMEIDQFYYFFNGKAIGVKGSGPQACKFRFLKKTLHSKPHYLRSQKECWNGRIGLIKTPKLIKNAGWHFTYIGDVKNIRYKWQSYGHIEVDKKYNKNDEIIKKMVEEGKFINGNKISYVPIDESFPKEIYKHQKKWNKLIKNERKRNKQTPI